MTFILRPMNRKNCRSASMNFVNISRHQKYSFVKQFLRAFLMWIIIYSAHLRFFVFEVFWWSISLNCYSRTIIFFGWIFRFNKLWLRRARGSIRRQTKINAFYYFTKSNTVRTVKQNLITKANYTYRLQNLFNIISFDSSDTQRFFAFLPVRGLHFEFTIQKVQRSLRYMNSSEQTRHETCEKNENWLKLANAEYCETTATYPAMPLDSILFANSTSFE